MPGAQPFAQLGRVVQLVQRQRGRHLLEQLLAFQYVLVDVARHIVGQGQLLCGHHRTNVFPQVLRQHQGARQCS